jgi:hypothetical protein
MTSPPIDPIPTGPPGAEPTLTLPRELIYSGGPSVPSQFLSRTRYQGVVPQVGFNPAEYRRTLYLGIFVLVAGLTLVLTLVHFEIVLSAWPP